MTREDGHDLDGVAAYALGSLSDPEAQAMERHLARCDTCAHELERARAVVDTLPSAAPPLRASPQLKRSVMGAVRRQAEPARRGRGLTAWLPRRPVLALAAGVAATALVLVGYGLGAVTGEGERQIAAAVDEARIPGAGATLAVSGDVGVLRAEELPRLGRAGVYVVWVDRGQGPVYSSSFNLRPDGTGEAGVAGLDRVERVMVTRERSTAVDQPTEDPVLTVELSS